MSEEASSGDPGVAVPSRDGGAGFLEHLDAIVFEIDVAQMTPTYVNGYASRLLGYPLETWTSQSFSWMEQVHSEDRAHVRDELQRTVLTAVVQKAHCRLVTARGEVVWVAGSLNPMLAPDGRVRAIRGVMIDITEQRKAQSQCQFLGEVLASIATPILLANPDGVITWTNEAFTKLTGYGAEEVLGKTPRILKSGRHAPEVYTELWRILRSGQVWRGEMVNRRKDGTLYTEEQTITPIRGDTGEITHFISIRQDISDRLQLEAQLRQAQKMEAIGQLAGGIAHDFNNLLLVINGYTELVLSRLEADHPQRADLLQVMKAGERAKGLTQQLLAFGRRQVLDPKVLDLNDVVHGMGKMLARIVPEHIRIAEDLSGDLGRVLADRGQVEQVIMNLVVNARDAMPDGGRLGLETRNAEIDAEYARMRPGVQPGRYVLLAVTDTGCGMTPEVLSRIFEPFYTTKPAGKGTGLGLSMVYGIVRQSGGHVDVASEPGRGARFLVFLPRAEAVPDGPEATQDVQASLLGYESVLLVEDGAEVRSVVRRFLEVYGYRVTEAADGVEALELASAGASRFDILLTDIVMPRLGGKALAERLLETAPHLRVVLMTGYTQDAGLRNGEVPEGWSVLQKPFSPRTLAERLRASLAGRAR